MNPDLSIIIPYFNRNDTVSLVLESISRARANLSVEILLVDDGSTPPAAETLRGQAHAPERIIRQENRGLLFARLAGLREARGEFVLFLDSDDLVATQKLRRQIAAMREQAAEVSYTDSTRVQLGASPADTKPIAAEAPLPVADDPADFFIRVQPPPHSPVFKTDWLRAIVARPLFAPSAAYNPVAEIWFYHVAAVHAAKVIKVTGADTHALIGQHAGARITGHWEKMAVASLAVMEAFMRSCASTAESKRVRGLVAAKAFHAWRALPKDFSPVFQKRLLDLWLAQPDTPPERLGGVQFARVSRWLGPVATARLLRRLRGHSYASCRTLDNPGQVEQWLRQLPVA